MEQSLTGGKELIVDPAVTIYPKRDKFLLELGNWCAEVIDLPRHLQDLSENVEGRWGSMRIGKTKKGEETHSKDKI